jgi:hypothetical protein
MRGLPAGALAISIDCFVASLLAMTVVAIVIANLPLGGVAISNLSVIARLPEGKPWQSHKEKISSYISRIMTKL